MAGLRPAFFLGFVSHNTARQVRLGWGTPLVETGGLYRWRHALRAILFVWAWFVTPPCFWCCFVPNYATHYTMLFDICQMLNEINRGYLPQKGTRGTEFTTKTRRARSSFLQDGRDFCHRGRRGHRERQPSRRAGINFLRDFTD